MRGKRGKDQAKRNSGHSAIKQRPDCYPSKKQGEEDIEYSLDEWSDVAHKRDSLVRMKWGRAERVNGRDDG